eukprot:gene696-957_t
MPAALPCFFAAALTPDEVQTLLRDDRRLPPHLLRVQKQQRTLLLVDDEPHILAALKRLFRRDGYQVLTAGSGHDGLELLRQHAVDVIVSDQRMPVMCGVDFLRQAKELCPHTVRMTLSGYTDLQSIIDAVNEGAVYKFLTKPWDDDRLREHVALAFRQRELDEDNQRLMRENAAANAELALANQRLARLAEQEHERALTLQDAAGAAHDLLGGLPLAVFGFDSESRLAYVNASALAEFPQWAADLADALTRACELDPALTIDMATLTGAARVALGPQLPPYFTDDEGLAAQIEAAARAEWDPLWR